MPDSSLDIARRRLLAPAGIDENDLDKVFGKLLAHAVDSGDLYFQSTRHESWVLEDGIVKEGSHSIEQGVGVRALSGEKTGFAYSDEIVLPALLEAAQPRRAPSPAQGGDGQVQAWHAGGGDGAVPPIPIRWRPMSADDKVALLEQLDAEARAQDPRVKQVVVTSRRRARGRAGRAQRRHAGRRRAAAGAPERHR